MKANWEEALWAELEQLPEEERIVVAGERIVHITRRLLPALGRVRRETVLQVLARPGWDATKLAGRDAGCVRRRVSVVSYSKKKRRQRCSRPKTPR